MRGVEEVVRELTPDERYRYGDCPVCQAKHGEACNPDVGVPLGLNIKGYPAPGGAHLGRLQRAPHKVREVPIE